MVCASTPRLFFEPQVCLARPILLQALERYEPGDYVGSGVRLRESVRRFLVAAVDWYAVELPKRVQRSKHPNSAAMARILPQVKRMDEWGLAAILEMLDVGNKAAHCQPFDPKALRGAISFQFCFLDSEPFSAMKERQPSFASTFDENADYGCDDCDDDDGADWWKSEGGAA